MFDIDGTLVQSYEFDGKCYFEAVEKVLQTSIQSDWLKYQNVTDSGILDEIIGRMDLQTERENLHFEVKKEFIKRVKNHVRNNKVEPILGAVKFIENLKNRKDVTISIATGGWRETAILKLESAGIDFAGIPIASASDHFERVEIMKIAEQKTGLQTFETKTYFGDGEWDKKASEILGYNFVLVGNRFENSQRIDNFTFSEEALKFIGF